MKTSLGTIIRSFFQNHLVREKNCSPCTISSHSYNMSMMLEFCCSEHHKSIENITLDDITDSFVLSYLDYLAEMRGNCPNTCNQRLALIRTFSRYIARQEPTFLAACERICAIQPKEMSHKIIHGLEVKEIKTIIGSPKTTSISGVRDHAMLLLMYNTGGRVQEIANIKTGDITRGTYPQILLTGKKGKQRVIPLWPEALEAITYYLELRGIPETAKEEPLFLNAKGEKITRFGIGYLVKKYTAIASKDCPELIGKNVTPHVLRHTTALNLIQAENDIIVVKEWLGHEYIKTTMQYLEINIKMKQAALEKWPSPLLCLKQTSAQWRESSLMTFLKGLSKVELC